jgi:hypothetical protein
MLHGAVESPSDWVTSDHQGAIVGGLVGTMVGAISFVFALLLGPETKGKELVPDLMVAPPARPALSKADGG